MPTLVENLPARVLRDEGGEPIEVDTADFDATPKGIAELIASINLTLFSLDPDEVQATPMDDAFVVRVGEEVKLSIAVADLVLDEEEKALVLSESNKQALCALVD